MSFRLAPSLAAFGLVAALAAPALADLPPPSADPCATLAEGDACVTDAKKDGTCVKQATGDTLVCTENVAGTTDGGCSLVGGHAGTAGALLALLGVSLF